MQIYNKAATTLINLLATRNGDVLKLMLLIVFVCGVSSLFACSSGNVLPASVASATAGGDVGAPDQTTYQIGPDDVLEIFVWRNPEISTTVSVRPDGMISTPLVEDMRATGKTPSELARDMEIVLSKYIKSPSVNIIVSGFQGTFSEQIRVVGQAVNPRAIPYRKGMTLLDVMIQVGGLSQFAAGNRSKIVRQVNGETIEYRVRLADLLNKGKISENIDLRPGDVLIIPETFF